MALVDKIKFSVPKLYRRGSLQEFEFKSINSGFKAIEYIKKQTNFSDWSDLNILDFGCGVKFAQAIIQYDIPFNNYYGLDVYDGMIKYLKENCPNEKMHFETVLFQNDMYNKNGDPMTEQSILPLDEGVLFDVIIMQSVITHFAPQDTKSILSVLRRYVSSKGKLFFTCFIDNDMNEDFRDENPERPLLRAFYKENYIIKLIEESGWKVEKFNLRSREHAVQNHFICVKS